MGTLPLNGLDQSQLASTTFAISTDNSSCPQGEVKAKILRGAEVKIFPFTNREQTGINTITFLPIAELSSSLAHDQPLLTLGDTL